MNNIFDEIINSNTILLLTHENPDGDAVGSLLAIYHMLKSMNKKVDAVMPEIPETFMYLNSIDKIHKTSSKHYDLAIVLDCASKTRVANTNNELDRCKRTLVIDHHTGNSLYGDVNHVEGEISSCCQVIYYLFKEWNIKITKDIGEALITGLLTDTVGFKNNNVDENSFLMAADLTKLGIDIHKIYYLALSKKTMAQYLLFKMALDKLELYDDGKIAFSYVSYEDMQNVGAKLGDHEGLVEIGRNIGGVEVSIFLRECGDFYRISLRSNGIVDVNKIAKKYGGGGHKMAAGIKLKDNFKEVKDALIEDIKKELEANERNTSNQ